MREETAGTAPRRSSEQARRAPIRRTADFASLSARGRDPDGLECDHRSKAASRLVGMRPCEDENRQVGRLQSSTLERGNSAEAVFADFPVEGALADAEDFGGLVAVAAGPLERASDEFLFDVAESHSGERGEGDGRGAFLRGGE